MNGEEPGFFSWVRDLDVIGLGAIFIWALYKRILRWGSDCDEIARQRNEYKEIVDRNHERVEKRLDTYESRTEAKDA